MFAFNDPKATEKINQLEEQLLTQSCGDATEFNVKSIIDNLIIGLCNEYYDNLENEGGGVPEFPNATPHDMDETLDQLTETVEGNSYYQIGQDVCEVCDNAIPLAPCYEAVNNCGTENYEECVKDKLCNFANSSFTSAQNWIMHEYGFDQFTIDNMEPDLLNELLYFNCNPNNIFNPCTGDVIPASIIINSILNSGIPYTLSSFYEELNKEDYIVLGESFSSNEKLKCIWDKIIYSNNDLMCSTLSNYFGGTKINLNLYVQNLIGRNSFTDILFSGSVYISIDQEYIAEACPIEILKTILHEAIHAEILRRHNIYTLAELEQMHPEMMVFFNDPDVSDYHHEYMANEWFDELLDAVISFYPSGFSMEEYETIVWSGLHNTDAFDQTSGIT